MAFCVYDLYKNLTPIFKKKEQEFREKIKKDEIDKDNHNEYNKLGLKNEIESITKLSTDKIEYYYTLMKEYIYNKKYKELITGLRN